MAKKQTKAVRKIEKAVRKAVKKGVTEGAVEKAVSQGMAKGAKKKPAASAQADFAQSRPRELVLECPVFFVPMEKWKPLRSSSSPRCTY